MAALVVEEEEGKRQEETREHPQGHGAHQRADVGGELRMKFGGPVVTFGYSADLQEDVEDVQKEEAESQIEGVHQNFAEELDFKSESVQVPRERIFAEVVESGILKRFLVMDMREVVVGGGKEHVESGFKSWHVVAAPVPLVGVERLVEEKPLRQPLDQLGNLDREDFQGKKDKGEDQEDHHHFSRFWHRVVFVEVDDQANDVDEDTDEGGEPNSKVDDLGQEDGKGVGYAGEEVNHLPHHSSVVLMSGHVHLVLGKGQGKDTGK